LRYLWDEYNARTFWLMLKYKKFIPNPFLDREDNRQAELEKRALKFNSGLTIQIHVVVPE